MCSCLYEVFFFFPRRPLEFHHVTTWTSNGCFILPSPFMVWMYYDAVFDTVDGHLVYFQFGAIMNQFASNNPVQVFMWICLHPFLRKCLEAKLLAHSIALYLPSSALFGSDFLVESTWNLFTFRIVFMIINNIWDVLQHNSSVISTARSHRNFCWWCTDFILTFKWEENAKFS